MNPHVASYCYPIILDAPGYTEAIVAISHDITQPDWVKWTVFNHDWIPSRHPHSLIRFVEAVGNALLIGIEPLAYWRRVYLNVVVGDVSGRQVTIPLCIGSMHTIIDLGELECGTRRKAPIRDSHRRRLRIA